MQTQQVGRPALPRKGWRLRFHPLLVRTPASGSNPLRSSAPHRSIGGPPHIVGIPEWRDHPEWQRACYRPTGRGQIRIDLQHHSMIDLY
jgi:hypothetical protein